MRRLVHLFFGRRQSSKPGRGKRSNFSREASIESGALGIAVLSESFAEELASLLIPRWRCLSRFREGDQDLLVGSSFGGSFFRRHIFNPRQ